MSHTKTQNREKFLESKFESEEQMEALEKKYWDSFDKQARYMGGGCYSWANIFATDTRELFLLGILGIEGIYNEDEL